MKKSNKEQLYGLMREREKKAAKGKGKDEDTEQKSGEVIRIAICDDEKPFLDRISEIIREYFEGIKTEILIRCFASGEALMKAIDTSETFDLYFLDVKMNIVDGIDVAREIRKYDKSVVIVFVTAFISYSTEGYKVDAFRYIIKNDKSLKSSMLECLNAIKDRYMEKPSTQTFTFRKFEKEVNIDDIIYIESKLHRLQFHLCNKKGMDYSMYGTLDKIEKQLSGYDFVRIHQSFLVNLKHITNILLYKICLSDGTQLVIPKVRYKAVKEAIIAYMGEM